SNGGAQGIGVAVSFDAGRTWRRPAAPPPFSQCAGGSYERAPDPWGRFGPAGELYPVALAPTPPARPPAVLRCPSGDGGRTWGPVQPLIADTDANVLNDKPALTADPLRPGRAYAVWTRLSGGASDGDDATARLRAGAAPRTGPSAADAD